jgi:hypothetical protein
MVKKEHVEPGDELSTRSEEYQAAARSRERGKDISQKGPSVKGITQEEKAEIATVDELLNQTAGVVTGKEGEVVVKGGRAGEVSKIVDGKPVDDPLAGIGIDSLAKSQESVLAATEPEGTKEPKVVVKRSKTTMVYQKTETAADTPAGMVAKQPVFVDTELELTDVEHWLHRRDSLQTLYAGMSSPHQALSEAKSRQKKDTVSGTEEVEWQLAYSHYQIARLTEDQAERTAAIAFLRSYVEKPQSLHKDRVEQMLQELEQIHE